MSANYLLGIFAIKPEDFTEVEKLFIRSGNALDNFDEDWDELEDQAYIKARESSPEFVELFDNSDVAPLTSFVEVIRKKAPRLLTKHKIYSPERVPAYLKRIKEIQTAANGEAGMIDKIWREDRILDKAGIKKFYDAYLRVLEFAAKNGCGFGVAMSG